MGKQMSWLSAPSDCIGSQFLLSLEPHLPFFFFKLQAQKIIQNLIKQGQNCYKITPKQIMEIMVQSFFGFFLQRK